MKSKGVGKRYQKYLAVCASASLIIGCATAGKNMGVAEQSAVSGEFETEVASIEENTRSGSKLSTEGLARDISTEQTLGSAEMAKEETIIEAKEKVLASSSDIAVLTNVSLDENQTGTTQVVLTLNEEAPYKLEKSAPSEYTVRLYGTTQSANVRTPLLSRSSDSLIRSVRTTTDGEDLVLRVFAKTESDVRVEQTSDGQITISASLPKQAMSSADEKIMAQMKPEKADEKSSDSKPAVSATSSDDDVDDEFAKFLEAAPKYNGRKISLDLQETDIDNALRIIAEVSNLNIIASDAVTGKVTLRLVEVPWDQALDVILKTNSLDKVQEGNVVRIAPVEVLKNERLALKEAKQAEQELEDLKVKYVRVSYAKAAELKPLIDTVVSERGMVTYDERTNQIIVKDIESGLRNVGQLVEKLDLRTPQVLLETQIVEASRSLLRDIGNEFGFSYVESPQTGNASGSNFPNSVQAGGSFSNPAATTANAISLLLGSADGSKSLSQIVTAMENEGTVRVVSRPAVATLNNKPAMIKSIEKIRIRLPQGGLSVATGAGASAAGQGNVASEIIEVGIVLEVTPQASPDYYVLLDINAKSSTLGTNTVDQIPSEIERSARSSVLVSSGQTFALGGIYKISDISNLDGLPFFKDIPVLGSLFRRASGENRDEELLFFVTPRIVEGSFDDATMTSDKK